VPPYGLPPHLFRFELELASAPRCGGGRILLLIYCSLVPRSQKSKTKCSKTTTQQTSIKYVVNDPLNLADQTIHESFLAKTSSTDLNVKSGRF
jgi:hypothetical protein